LLAQISAIYIAAVERYMAWFILGISRAISEAPGQIPNAPGGITVRGACQHACQLQFAAEGCIQFAEILGY